MRFEMRKGMVVSLGLHVAVLVLVVTGLPSILNTQTDQPQIIPVEIMPISERTVQKPPEVKPEPKPEPPKPEPPKPEPKNEPPPKPKAEEPAPPKPVAEKPAPKPEPPKPDAVPEIDVKVKPRPKPKPPSRFDPSQIAKLLKDTEEKDETPAAQPQPQSIDVARLTMSLQDAIRSQVQPCWLFPAGAPNAEDLVVRLRITLNPDGSLSRPPEILDQGRLAGNDYYRVAAESARRAVQKCSPLKLPVDAYDVWQDIELNFDPKEMITG